MSGRRHRRQGFVVRPPHAKRAMAETTEATEAAARVSEVEALFKIHGVDQRSSELLYAHPALGGDASPVRLRQDGSDSAAFVPGTSTVIWPCAYSLGDFLCDATAAVRASDDPRRGDPAHAASLGAITPETVVVEVGAGLGLAGLVAARLGAKRVSITDATTAAARRNLEASGLTNATVDELWWQRASWRRARGKAKKRKALDRRTGAPSGADATCAESDESQTESDEDEPAGAPDAAATAASVLRSLRPNEHADVTKYPHMIVASDVCYSQGRREMQMLADTMGALCGFETTVWVMFEDRGDCCWGTLQHFWRATESAGLEGDPTPVEEVTVLGEPRTSQRRHNDSERLLLRLRRARETPAE
jgi:predicted nicotinamide N-methyase